MTDSRFNDRIKNYINATFSELPATEQVIILRKSTKLQLTELIKKYDDGLKTDEEIFDLAINDLDKSSIEALLIKSERKEVASVKTAYNQKLFDSLNKINYVKILKSHYFALVPIVIGIIIYIITSATKNDWVESLPALFFSLGAIASGYSINYLIKLFKNKGKSTIIGSIICGNVLYLSMIIWYVVFIETGKSIFPATFVLLGGGLAAFIGWTVIDWVLSKKTWLWSEIPMVSILTTLIYFIAEQNLPEYVKNLYFIFIAGVGIIAVLVVYKILARKNEE